MAGHCFHLYTKFRYDHHFRKDPLPEILRVPLEQAILRIKVLPLFENREVSKVMSNLLEPPAWEAVANAVSRCGTQKFASSNFYISEKQVCYKHTQRRFGPVAPDSVLGLPPSLARHT